MHRRLLQLAASTRAALALTFACGLLAGLLTIVQAWLVSSTIDAVFLGRETLSQVMGWMQLILLVLTGRSALAWLGETSACAVAVPIKNSLRRRLFAHILNLGPAYSRAEHTGELTAAAVEGIEALDAYYRQYLPQLAVSTLVPLSILAIVFPADPLSGAILILTAPLIPFFMYMIGKGAEAATGRRYETLSRLSSYFLDSLQGLTTLKIFGQSKAQAGNIASVSDQFRDATLRVLQVTFLSALALELLATLSTAIIAVEVGLRLLYARMEFREALFILILAPEFYLPLRMLGLRFHAGMSGVSAARRIFQILDTSAPVRSAGPMAAPALPRSINLELRDVAYTYPGSIRPALEGIHLSIERGRHIALVGPSGAGKTTLVNLLLRFIEPDHGRILLDGHLLSDVPIEQWREMIAWVPQTPHLFNGTIASNIRLGKPMASDQEMIQAARLAHLDQFIESLPRRYETAIGEGGARLSSGQAQRLALARAFLKDAPILLMDEPTSSLDPETESILEQATRRLMEGRTVITIAHRLNTVFRADRILVLDAGRIIEAGTHRELLATGGLYSSLAAPYQAGETPTEQAPSPEVIPDPGRVAEPSALIASTPGPPQQEGILRRLLRFLNGSWHRVALSALLSTLTIGSSVALMGTSAWMISMAALHPSIAALGVSVVGVRFFGIARGVFRYLERLVSHDVTFRLLARLRVWFYERLEPLAPARLMDFRLGDLLARIVSDVETLENFYVRGFAPPLAAVLVAASTAFFLARWDFRLGLILIASHLLLGLLLPLLMQRLSRRPGIQLVAQRSRLQAQLVDSIQGLADLMAFGRGRDTLDSIGVLGTSYGQAERHMAWIGGLEAGMMVLAANLALWTVLLVCIPLASGSVLPGTMLASLALLTMASFEAVMPLPAAARTWSTSREAARRLFEVVDASPTVVDQSSLPKPAGVSDGGRELPSVEVRDLSFTYPGRSEPALQGVSFSLEQGRSLAIVGPSGAGKSTLAWLLLRFWEYGSGEILLSGQRICDYTQEQVRAQISFVSSHDHIFNTTIRENLRMARRGLSSSEIEQAAMRAQIHDSILHMPQGYETLAGEHGQRLSGGERQRLAIARALLKDAPLLLLDEPTANLDPLTERAVLEVLFTLMKSRTTLLITHRLVGMEHVDEILVMHHGRIVERGTHADLLQRDGLYRRLWDLQHRQLADSPLFRA